MQYEFTKHKSNNSFPFWIFGYITCLLIAFINIYLYINNFSFTDIYNSSVSNNLTSLFYIIFIVIFLLFFILSIGIIKKLRSFLNVFSYISLFIFVGLGLSSAFLIESEIFYILKEFFVYSFLYFLVFYLVTLIQNKFFVIYSSSVLKIINLFPIIVGIFISLLYFDIIQLSKGYINASFYIGSLLIIIYIMANSIYLCKLEKAI